jgi:hypothetical protein
MTDHSPNGATLYAVIDPNWGEPRIIPNTIASGSADAIHKAVHLDRLALWSGLQAQVKPLIPGEWERLHSYGFKVARIRVEIEEMFSEPGSPS